MNQNVETNNQRRSCNFEIEGIKAALSTAFEAERMRRPEWQGVSFGEPEGAGLTLLCQAGEKHVIVMSLMYAHPAHRGKGLARWMFDALTRLCDARGLNLELRARREEVADLGHLTLIDIFQEAGFELLPDVKGAQLRMRKPRLDP